MGNNCMWRWQINEERNRDNMVRFLLFMVMEDSSRRCCMECNHLIIVANIDMPSRTMKDSGTDSIDGRGYPLEKRRMSSRTLSSSSGERER